MFSWYDIFFSYFNIFDYFNASANMCYFWLQSIFYKEIRYTCNKKLRYNIGINICNFVLFTYSDNLRFNKSEIYWIPTYFYFDIKI